MRYTFKAIVDTTAHSGEEGDDAWQRDPIPLEIDSMMHKFKGIKNQCEALDEIVDGLQEHVNLVMNNDQCGQVIRLTMTTEIYENGEWKQV